MDISWKEVVNLLKAYKYALEEENEEDLVHIANVLPDEIKIGKEITIEL